MRPYLDDFTDLVNAETYKVWAPNDFEKEFKLMVHHSDKQIHFNLAVVGDNIWESIFKGAKGPHVLDQNVTDWELFNI